MFLAGLDSPELSHVSSPEVSAVEGSSGAMAEGRARPGGFLTEELKSRPGWGFGHLGPPKRVPGFVHVGAVSPGRGICHLHLLLKGLPKPYPETSARSLFFFFY